MGGEVIGTIVAPAIGSVLAVLVFLSPWRAVAEARESGDLKSINGFPFLMMGFQAAMWLIYGFFADLIALLPCNVIGYTLGAYYVLVCYSLTTDETTRKYWNIGISFVLAFPSIFAGILYFGVEDASTRAWYFGLTCNIIGIGFLFSPLSVIVNVLRTRDASSMSFPLSVTLLLCTSFWAIFGLASSDWFIAVVNTAGFFSSICQIGTFLFCRFFPKTAIEPPVEEMGDMKSVIDIMGVARGQQLFQSFKS
eukprot:TRINITY_DN11092_c0_g1_i1.p1 TRINITY_DN11092_c0_g1~~TRINITY_DN11092_c0_g1_i1.p1  ORF type:complete len:251 (-),score=36.63 TRINITY_DN11092_c0_g1_i1:14-766(-)